MTTNQEQQKYPDLADVMKQEGVDEVMLEIQPKVTQSTEIYTFETHPFYSQLAAKYSDVEFVDLTATK